MPVFQLSNEIIFPPPELAREDGLLAVGGDLSEARILFAYQMGIFPWYSEGEPILWWSPTPRLILSPEDFKLSKRLARQLRKGDFSFTVNHCFAEIISQCATTRARKGEPTWIHPEMIEAYLHLHKSGFAHSIECWHKNELAGGLYGLAIGRVFFGESMFSRVSNSSKAALHHLCQLLRQWDYDFIDCQMTTAHLLSLGAREVPGHIFYDLLQKAVLRPTGNPLWPPPECRGSAPE